MWMAFINLKAGIPDISTAAIGTYRRPSGTASGRWSDCLSGALKLQDVDKSGIVDLDDVVDLGEVQAKHTGGFSLNGNYKKILILELISLIRLEEKYIMLLQ